MQADAETEERRHGTASLRVRACSGKTMDGTVRTDRSGDPLVEGMRSLRLSPALPLSVLTEHVLRFLDRRTFNAVSRVNAETYRTVFGSNRTHVPLPPWPPRRWEFDGEEIAAFALGNRFFASGTDAGAIRLLDRLHGRVRRLPSNHAGLQLLRCFDDRWLASAGTHDEHIRLWKLNHMTVPDRLDNNATVECPSLVLHKAGETDVFDMDLRNNVLAMCGYSGRVCLYSIAHNDAPLLQPTHVIGSGANNVDPNITTVIANDVHYGSMCCLRFVSDRTFLVAGDDGDINEWTIHFAQDNTVSSLTLVRTYRNDPDIVVNCLALVDGERFWTAGNNGVLRQWSRVTGALSRELTVPKSPRKNRRDSLLIPFTINDFASDTDSDQHNSDEHNSGDDTAPNYANPLADMDDISSIAVSPNRKLLAVAGVDGRVTVWNLQHRQDSTQKHYVHVGNKELAALDVSFSSDSFILFVTRQFYHESIEMTNDLFRAD